MRKKFNTWVLFIISISLLNAVYLAQSEPIYKETTSLPDQIQMHGSAVLGNFLYVFGGNKAPEGWTTSVRMAPIHQDGSLGNWGDTTPLPSPRAYIANSALALNDVVYIIGGLESDPGKKHNTAIWSRPRPDGHLEPWLESPPFGPEGISNVTVVSTPGFIHLIGGLTLSGVATSAVISGPVSPGGAIATWEGGPPLPVPLWFHNAVAMGGRVWVWGGLFADDRSRANQKVYSSPILGSGRLGLWRKEPVTLPEPLYSAAQSSAGNYIISFCPRVTPNAKETDDVWFATVSSQGLSPWQKISTGIPLKLYITAAPDYRRGNVYIPGGRLSAGAAELVDKRVFFFKLAAHASTREETQNIEDQGVGTPSPASLDISAYMDNIQTASTPKEHSLTYMSESRVSSDATKGFISYDQARIILTSGKPMPYVLYFNSKKARRCVEQGEILKDPNFANLASRAPFVWFEISEWPQLSQQLGVFRTPSWIFYDSGQREKARFYNVLTMAQLEQNLSSLH
ncbi:hypothetical protein JW926_10465 [Candidatus Sumerlaeota bacterium]|nr:hypothetical protein [Candidatus Sumerlaeota bacterium]